MSGSIRLCDKRAQGLRTDTAARRGTDVLYDSSIDERCGAIAVVKVAPKVGEL